MSFRIVCLSQPPVPSDAYDWAEAVLHDETSISEICAVADKYARERPLKISVEVCEAMPFSWVVLHLLLTEEYEVPEGEYSVRDLIMTYDETSALL